MCLLHCIISLHTPDRSSHRLHPNVDSSRDRRSLHSLHCPHRLLAIILPTLCTISISSPSSLAARLTHYFIYSSHAPCYIHCWRYLHCIYITHFTVPTALWSKQFCVSRCPKRKRRLSRIRSPVLVGRPRWVACTTAAPLFVASVLVSVTLVVRLMRCTCFVIFSPQVGVIELPRSNAHYGLACSLLDWRTSRFSPPALNNHPCVQANSTHLMRLTALKSLSAAL